MAGQNGKKSSLVVIVAGVAMLFLASCRTSRPVTPLLAAATAGDAAQQLQNWNGVLRSFARIEVVQNGVRRGFKARIEFDRAADRLSLTALTPVGTTALILLAEGDRVTYEDRIKDKEWSGELSQLASDLALPPLRDARQLGEVIYGLVPADAVAGERAAGIVMMRVGSYTSQVTRTGVGIAADGAGNWQARYEPAQFPPKILVIETRDGSRRLLIEHLEYASE